MNDHISDDEFNYYKKIMILITLLIDFVLVYIYMFDKTTLIDRLFIVIAMCIHVGFLTGLATLSHILLDFSHILMFLVPLWSMFVNNKSIKTIVILLLLFIEAQWIYTDECMLNHFPTNIRWFGIGKHMTAVVNMMIAILLYQILMK